MALKSTIYKANIQLSDMDRNYYDTINLTIAKHPSETDQRLMIRLVCFLLNAHQDLQFGKGISDEDEAAIWQKNYSDEIELWIELGQVDSRRIKKACSRAKQVILYTYGNDIWWPQVENKIVAFDNLSVKSFPKDICQQLEQIAARNMEMQCSIQDGQMWLTLNEKTLLIETQILK